MNDQQPHNKMTFQTKLIFTTIVSIIWVLATIGQTSLAPDLSDIILSDYRLDSIFQTTIAIQTKVFRKRINKTASGVLSYLPINTEKWVDVDIELKTRIGFKVDQSSSLATLNPRTNNYNFDFKSLKPVILDRQGTVDIVDKSDNIFSWWDIAEYDQNKKQLLENIFEAESQLQLASFQNDQTKMASLIRRLQSQLDSILNTNRFSVKIWINQLNRKVNQLAHQLFYILTGINPRSYPLKEQLSYQIYNTNSPQIKPSQQKQRKNYDNNKQPQSKFKAITYNQQETRLRNQMRQTQKNK